MNLFTEWLQDRKNEAVHPLSSSGSIMQHKQSEVDLYSARETLKNCMANMRSNPMHWLGEGIAWAMQKVRGHRQAEEIVSNMQNVASRFFQEIRDRNLMIYDQRQGGVMTPRMPNEGERGFEEYQRLYLSYYDRLHKIWQNLDRLAAA